MSAIAKLLEDGATAWGSRRSPAVRWPTAAWLGAQNDHFCTASIAAVAELATAHSGGYSRVCCRLIDYVLWSPVRSWYSGAGVSYSLMSCSRRMSACPQC